MEREFVRFVGAGLVVLVDSVGNPDPADLAPVEDYSTILIGRALEAETPGLAPVVLRTVQGTWTAVKALGLPERDVNRYLLAIPAILAEHRPSVAACQGAMKAQILGQSGSAALTSPAYKLSMETVGEAERSASFVTHRLDPAITLSLLERLFSMLLPERQLIMSLVPLLRPAGHIGSGVDSFADEERGELHGSGAR